MSITSSQNLPHKSNHKESKSIGNFKSWKVKIHKNFDQKSLGYGVGTLLPYNMKNVFQENLIRPLLAES